MIKTRVVVMTALLTAIGALGVPAHAQPANWLQGIWNGTCTRGTKTANAQLVLAYSSTSKTTTGALNGHALTNLAVSRTKITFMEREKSFEGSFRSDFNQLTAELDKGPKSASCSLTRSFKESDKLCLHNSTGQDLYVWLDSPNGSGGAATFILRVDQRLDIQGDRTGTLCFDGKDFRPPKCPAQIPQKSYSCQ